MKTNQSSKERIARVLTGLVMLKNAKTAKLKLLGLVPLLTGATGYCPAKDKLKVGKFYQETQKTNPQDEKAENA